MHISIPKRALDRMTEAELRNIERRPEILKGLKSLEVNLLELDEQQTDILAQAMRRLVDEKVPIARSLATDIERWVNVVRNGANGQEIPRTVRQFADLVTQYIAASPGHRVYKRQSDGNEWLAYYVNHVEYESERNNRDTYRQARVEINMLYWRLGVQYSYSTDFKQSDIDGRTVAEATAAKGLSIETEDLREQYLTDRDAFNRVFPMLGRQFQTRGSGYEMNRSAIRRRVRLTADDAPAKVVIDIVGDDGEDSRYGNEGVRPYFWSGKRPKANRQAQSDSLSVNDAIIDGRPAVENPHDPEIPIHPYVPVYHLSRHTRYRVNVSELEEYQFNTQLDDQLVLPKVTKNLVDVLVSQGRVSFRDIIEGKGAGACILLGGPPGVGKTLTAEVFAEATERPLLSVQAAQLGTSPNDIEQQLQSVLQRGSRWNAVVLLDEADVYIDERGGDIHQNAVVAAFLRVLENHAATIFLTTNRLERVDDAIASRCLARIDYEMPTAGDQKLIWKVLNDNNETGLTDELIDEIVARHGDLSGRDIKQLMKLAVLWAAGTNEPITAETIDFAASFMPTRSASADGAKNQIDR